MAQDYALEERQAVTQTTTKMCFKKSSLDPNEHVEKFKLKCVLTTNTDLVGKSRVSVYLNNRPATLLRNDYSKNY